MGDRSYVGAASSLETGDIGFVWVEEKNRDLLGFPREKIRENKVTGKCPFFAGKYRENELFFAGKLSKIREKKAKCREIPGKSPGNVREGPGGRRS